jgi:ATP-binding cassette, subfamily B, bacterial AbcA/BmrA
MQKTMKEKKRGVWGNYFRMLMHAGLPWAWMLVCLALSLGRAELTLIFADRLGETFGGKYADLHEAITPLLILLAIGLSIVIAKVVGAHLEGILTAQLERNIQRYAVKQVFYLKVQDIEKDDPREIVTRLTEDTAKSAKFVVDLSVNEIPRLYYIVMAIIQVVQMNLPVLTVTLICVVPLIFLGSWLSGKITFKNRNKIQTKIAVLTAKLAEKIDNVEVIKSYNNQEKEISSGNEVIQELDKVKKQGAVVDQINAFIKNMMWFLPLLLIIIPPAIYLFDKTMSQAQFYAYILLATSFRTYTAEHLTLWIYLKDAQGATLRLATILSSSNEKKTNGILTPEAGDIVFENVSFAYDKEPVLKDVSFTLHKGEKTALVGLSGSGKSTILNLIERFYEPSEGKITLGGKDISQYGYSDYRSLFAYLPQNAPGFSGTLRDLLNYCADKPYSDERLLQVLGEVGLAEEFASLGGLDYCVGYGAARLSGGQRQKIGVARLLLSENEYVLLDEATSALDAQASADIQRLVDASCKNRTEIAVAHNLKTVKNADRILVFHQGKLVGEGRHDELVKTCPDYQKLVREAQ